MNRFLTLVMTALMWAASLNAITPVETWEAQDAGIATVRMPDIFEKVREFPTQTTVLPGAGSTRRPYQEQVTLYETKKNPGSMCVLLFRYKADDGKPSDMQDVRRKLDDTVNGLSKGKSQIRWLNFSKDELRGFTTFDDPYGEAGVLKSKTRNMICHILRKGDEIYLVEARFDREMPEPLTLEEENQIVKGISGSLKPKAVK